MRLRITPIVIIFGALAAAGCTSAPLSELSEATPRGSAVSRALSDEYKRIADFEFNEMLDLRDGEHFARKGLRAARGEEPAPETVADWRVPASHVAYLRSARNRLAATLANRPDGAAPKTAAAAQASYDCWIEQQEENFQPGDIARCRSRYLAAVNALEIRGDYPHSVFFDLDDARLGPKASRRIRQLAAKAVRLGVPRITVFGHADSSGGGRHNLSLSLRRAARVEQALIEAGVARSRVGIAAAGETRPRIATANGVPEARNRRVELLFQPAVGW